MAALFIYSCPQLEVSRRWPTRQARKESFRSSSYRIESLSLDDWLQAICAVPLQLDDWPLIARLMCGMAAGVLFLPLARFAVLMLGALLLCTCFCFSFPPPCCVRRTALRHMANAFGIGNFFRHVWTICGVKAASSRLLWRTRF